MPVDLMTVILWSLTSVTIHVISTTDDASTTLDRSLSSLSCEVLKVAKQASELEQNFSKLHALGYGLGSIVKTPTKSSWPAPLQLVQQPTPVLRSTGVTAFSTYGGFCLLRRSARYGIVTGGGFPMSHLHLTYSSRLVHGIVEAIASTAALKGPQCSEFSIGQVLEPTGRKPGL
ncbi:hypothetical protein Tco_1155725 [Tanacetum coccineum]